MASRFAHQAKMRITDDKVEPASMRPAVYRIVALGITAFFESEKHGPNERHQRALSGFVRPVKYVQSRPPQRSPVLIRPYSETINVDVLNSHNVLVLSLWERYFSP